jgi:ADP-ribose pyrophosphatase
VSREYPDSPRVGVGSVIVHEGRVLLVLRGNPPSEGLWAIPGGMLRLGETLRQGAEREAMEECGVKIRAAHPIYAFDFIEQDDGGRVRFHYVIVDLLAEWLEGEPHPADDALDARWFAPEELAAGDLPIAPETRDLLGRVFSGKLPFGEKI